MSLAWVLGATVAFCAQEEEKQETLEERVARLEKAQEKEKGRFTFLDDGLVKFQTADGNFTAQFGGRFYGTYRHVVNPTKDSDSFAVDTARFRFDFTFYKDFFARVEGEFAKSGAFALKDGFIGWRGLPDLLTVRFGQMKEPFSQEETCSSRFNDFGERSIMNQLTPSTDIGWMANGALFGKIFEWELGLFNGAGRNIAPDLNDGKELAARLRVTPFRKMESVWIKQLRLGLAFTYGKQPAGALPDYTTRDLGGQTVVDFPATGVGSLTDDRLRLGGELSWLFGPFSLRAEHMLLRQDITGPSLARGRFDATGFTVQATYLLTGEDKPLEDRVKPKGNFSPANGTWGAFEVAARIAGLDAGDAEEAGLASSSTNTSVLEATLGLNWWMTQNVVLRVNWEHFIFGREIPVGADAIDDQDVFYVRWQIDF